MSPLSGCTRAREPLRRPLARVASQLALLPLLAVLALACARATAPGAPPPNPPLPPTAKAPAPGESPTKPAILQRETTSHGITYVFRASRLTNLAWQLDCLSDLGPCSRPAYEQLWKAKLDGKLSLRPALARWAKLRRTARGRVGDTASEDDSPLPLPRRSADLAQRMQLASVLATERSDYERLVRILTGSQTASDLGEVLERFDRAFDDIWSAALPGLEQAIAEQSALQVRDDIAETIRRVEAFYGADLGAERAIHFELLFRPEHRSATHAVQLLDRSMVEVVASEPPALRIQVPLHEMFHYFFATASHANLDALAKRFAESPNPEALAAYGLLDEVLATGLAQGALGRKLTPLELEAKLATPGRLYGDPYIDAVTKAFLPRLEQILAARLPQREALFSADFATAYLDAVKRAFPKGLPPAAQLRPMACAYSEELERAYKALRSAARSPLVGSSNEPDSDDSRALLEDRPKWARVLLLRSDRVSALTRYTKLVSAGAIKAVRQATRNSQSFAYATRASGVRPVFVLVAKTNDDAERLVREFVALDATFSDFALRSGQRASDGEHVSRTHAAHSAVTRTGTRLAQ